MLHKPFESTIKRHVHASKSLSKKNRQELDDKTSSPCVSGTWINDRTYGSQFKASFVKVIPPNTLEGIEKYLGSGLIKGIGPVYAKKLVNAFGESVFEVIEEGASRLQKVEGIGPHRSSMIVKGWADQKSIREIMLFLHEYGISTSRAVRIYKTFGAEAISVITNNPYELARHIKGIGFITADAIAQKVGIPPKILFSELRRA